MNKTDPRFQNSIIRQYQNTSWSFLINNGSTGYRATSLDPQNSNQWWLWQVWTSKYIDTGATTAYSSRQNWHVIRLADVYLMRAESAAELNSNPSLASQDINILRQRVGMSELDISAMTMDNFRTLLLKERAVELFMEGHRFFDLTRFGVYDEYCRNVLDPIPNTDGSRQPDDYIWPIPITEISANSNIN